MNDVLLRIPPLAAGILMGALFFGGLWWSVQKGLSSRQPALWFLGSALIRMSVTLVGFYLVGRGRWDRLLLCLLGFLIAHLRRPPDSPGRSSSNPVSARGQPGGSALTK